MDLSVIIISYNTRELLGKCLKPVEGELTKGDISGEIIVVDNNSRDDSKPMLHGFMVSRLKKFPVRLIKNRKNWGFGRANNQGAKIAQGRYLLFLNSDTEVKSGALAKMVNFMDRCRDAGIASGKLLNSEGTIQPQGGCLPWLSTVAIWALFIDDLPILKEILPSYQSRSKLRPNLCSARAGPFGRGWVGGTAMFVRRKAWDQLKGFDEKIFMYGEDVEICYRANQKGWKVMINPEAEIVHAGKASGGKWAAGETRGLLYVFKKHKPGWEMPILRTILAAGMGLRWLIFGILAGNESLCQAYAEAVREAVRG